MTPFFRPHGLLLAATLLLSACAGQTVRAPDAPARLVEASTQVDAAAPVEQAQVPAEDASQIQRREAAEQTQAAAGAAVAEAAPTPPAAAVPANTTPSSATTAAEDDFNALYGHSEYDPVADDTLPPGVVLPASYDPWERYNRRMHEFNNLIDRTIAKPLAKLYMRAIPRPVRLGVGNFFNNLGQPVSAVNALLQGRPKDAGFALLRFTVNVTLGLGGVFDPATKFKIPYRQEDFGQTLAVWGWRRSRYLELPLFGPRTVRDVLGMAADAPLSPLPHIGNAKTQGVLRGLQLVDIRTRLFSVDSMREGVADEYALYRDAWLQRRNYQITSGLRSLQKQPDNLPDYLREEQENPSMPIPVHP